MTAHLEAREKRNGGDGSQERTFHRLGAVPSAKDGCIWVFGSNLAGGHGTGAAKVARVNFGAAHGVASGRTGYAYAIPVRDRSQKALSLDEIREAVEAFITHARDHAHERFFVTRICCESGHYEDSEIAALFMDASVNCALPIEWKPFVAFAHITPHHIVEEVS